MTFSPDDQHLILAGHLPVFDDRPLTDLLDALDNDTDAVARFVEAFVDQWPDRVTRIADRLSAADSGGALTAILSLKVSSGMIGATRLTSFATGLESAVRRADFGAGLRDLPTLREIGAATLLALPVRWSISEAAVALPEPLPVAS